MCMEFSGGDWFTRTLRGAFRNPRPGRRRGRPPRDPRAAYAALPERRNALEGSMAFIPGSAIAILRPSKKRSPLRPGWIAKNTAVIATDPEMSYQIVAERMTHALSWLTQNVQALANKNFAPGQVASKRTPNTRDLLRKNVQAVVNKA